jgi:hypothetical protein
MTLPPISLKNTAKLACKKSNLKKEIVTQLKENGIETLKLSLEITEYVCNIIENVISKNKKNEKTKVDKKSLVIDILTEVFAGLKPEELLVIEEQITYLHENGIIRKMPWKIIIVRLYNYGKHFLGF